jgi:mannose-6-phosphate isomerase-like protein (cupin superfamily)
MEVGRLDAANAFTTLDGSTIREVAGAVSLATQNQSLAEATVPAGGSTDAHFHRTSEEIYFFTSGRGRMRLGDEEAEVAAGDCVVIPPGVEHRLWAGEDEPLVLLCCCAPAYSDEDTVITASP